MDDLLNLTIEALPKHPNEKWVDEFLDICGITNEIVPQSKENVKDFQSCLKRRKRIQQRKKNITNKRINVLLFS